MARAVTKRMCKLGSEYPNLSVLVERVQDRVKEIQLLIIRMRYIW
jgi:hypothetical protein